MDEMWIIDLLGDLRAFAIKNNLPHLAGQLHIALAVAEDELSQGTSGAHLRVVQSDGPVKGTLHREARASSDP